MTIPVSTVPTAIAALTSQIQTVVNSGEGTNAPSVGLFTGDEDGGMYRPNDRIIVATNVRRTVKPQVLMGSYQQGSLNETYTIDVLVSSYTGDNDPVTNMNRAWVLVGYVETAVRTDPTLGTDVLESHPGGTQGGQSYFTEDPIGRQTDIIVSVDVLTLN